MMMIMMVIMNVLLRQAKQEALVASAEGDGDGDEGDYGGGYDGFAAPGTKLQLRGRWFEDHKMQCEKRIIIIKLFRDLNVSRRNFVKGYLAL